MSPNARQFNCPNCGGALQASLRFAKVVACGHCDSMVMLEDDTVRLAGKQGVMAQVPSLLEMHQPFVHKKISYTPIGHVRFAYAHGFWDEWWTHTAKDAFWISVDEGDIAIEQPLVLDEGFDTAKLRTGKSAQINGAQYLVTESGHATCEAVRGEIPEAISPGDSFDYWHLSGRDGTLVTIEAEKDVVSATRGEWVNPYEVERQPAKPR